MDGITGFIGRATRSRTAQSSGLQQTSVVAATADAPPVKQAGSKRKAGSDYLNAVDPSSSPSSASSTQSMMAALAATQQGAAAKRAKTPGTMSAATLADPPTIADLGSRAMVFGAATGSFLDENRQIAEVLNLSDDQGHLRVKVAAYWPSSRNTGVGLERNYPMSNEGYRADAATVDVHTREDRSMFSAVPDDEVGFVRGHLTPHADTPRTAVSTSGNLSTYDAENYYPELEGWGEKQRKHRESKARDRETPVVQVNIYGNPAPTTANGTPIPQDVYFIELTDKSTDTDYSGKKDYGAKAYHIDYSTFDYDSLPSKTGGDRKVLKQQRVYDKELPSFVQEAAQQLSGLQGYAFDLGAKP